MRRDPPETPWRARPPVPRLFSSQTAGDLASPDWPVLMVIAMAVVLAVLAGLLAATLVSHVD